MQAAVVSQGEKGIATIWAGNSGLSSMLVQIVREEGVRGLYRGFTVATAGAGPAHALYYAVYELTKRELGANRSGHRPLSIAAAGVAATVVNDAVMTPADVVKQRLQIDRGRYKGALDCTMRIWRQEGVTAFYRSYPATLLANVPWTILHFPIYESSKKLLAPGREGREGTAVELAAGGLAGGLAAVLTTPFDVVKTRLQLGSDGPIPARRAVDVFAIMRHIAREEGPGALLCQRMRSLVHDCLAKHLYDSAIFYADKLVTMSNGAAADVYTLAEAFYMGRQWRRALALLRNAGLIEADIRCRYLAARCLAEVQDWEECLNVLGGWDESELEALSMQDIVLEDDIGQGVSYTSAMCLLRGRVYEALENRARAIRWYKAALHVDPFCYEAFRALAEGHMLTSEEEAALRETLHYREEDRWLHLFYRAKCKMYDQQQTMEGTLDLLEAPAPTPVPAPPPTPSNEEAATPLQPSTSAKLNAHKDSDASPGVRTRSMAQRSSSNDMEDDLVDDAENSGKGGCGLGGNLDVSVCRAEWYFHLGGYQECHALTSQLLDQDPYALEAMPVHLAAALELRKKNELFLRAHKLVEEYPDRAVSWFGVACYYLCIGRYENARRYFGKATTVDASFAPAWLGFGHAFAAQDESDQATAAYRTAARLFPGLHLPLLGMGCEYARMNNTALAEQLLLSAHRMCPQDPLPCNELGCLLFRARSFDAAERWLSRALERVPGRLTEAWEPTVVNLGHTLRKQRRYSEAIQMLERALGLCPGQPGTYSALGYTYHLQGRMQEAIDNYHKALSLRPEDTFTAEMLTAAVEECADIELAF
ncbi:hypothetical protein WJX75_001308 [Coccomyxa subellipsoidea]|uniref:Mitochondrial carrier n=1 Tax=Coccomyxa subellipsoidea TaxID=248742 RepID=A0ABR2YHF5_9CHLO